MTGSGRRARLVAAVLGLALAACGATADAPKHDVRVVLYSDPSSLSLIGNTDQNSAQIASVISDGLVSYDVAGRYVPMVARSWELTPDGKTLTFHLRDGVKWQDGRPVTSKDVAFTVRKIRDPAAQARSWVSYFADVTSVETPDDATVVVHYSRSYADALEPWRVPLIPEHIAGKDADFLSGAFARHPVGCGPFRFVSFAPGQSVVLEPFEGYWGGPPKIGRLIIKIVGAERTGYEALLLGDVDLMAVTPDLWKESLSSPGAARLARFVYYRLNVWKVDWNQTAAVPYFHDSRVREALVMALDREKFATAVIAGLARPAVSSYLPENPWSDPSIKPIPFDPKASAELLDVSGWRLVPGRSIRQKDGRPLAFTLLLAAGSQELVDRVAAWMQQSLAAVNVDMKIEKVEWKVFQQRRKAHAFEAAMAAVNVDPTPDQYDLYHSAAANNGFNYGGFSDAEVDRLLEQGRSTIDSSARRVIYQKLQRRLREVEPIGFLFQFAQPVLRDPRLAGVEASSMGLFQFAPGPRAWHWADASGGR